MANEIAPTQSYVALVAAIRNFAGNPTDTSSSVLCLRLRKDNFLYCSALWKRSASGAQRPVGDTSGLHRIPAYLHQRLTGCPGGDQKYTLVPVSNDFAAIGFHQGLSTWPFDAFVMANGPTLISFMRRSAQQRAENSDHGDAGADRQDGSFRNKSVVRAFAILKAFYSPDEWVAASELSRRAKIHEATLNRFMQSLLSVGAVVRDNSGKYRCVLFAMPGAPSVSINAREH